MTIRISSTPTRTHNRKQNAGLTEFDTLVRVAQPTRSCATQQTDQITWSIAASGRNMGRAGAHLSTNIGHVTVIDNGTAQFNHLRDWLVEMSSRSCAD